MRQSRQVQLTPSAFEAPEQAIILAGGLRTRLGAFTRQTPKPLLDVGGRPFLDYLIDNCIRFGFRKILLLAGHLGGQVEKYVQRASQRTPAGIDISVMIELEPVVTGGALRLATERLEERLLLLNADSFFDMNWLDLMLSLSTSRQTFRLDLDKGRHRTRSPSVSNDGRELLAQ
jgi:NDP-sugar pyrophosphorylase family protein